MKKVNTTSKLVLYDITVVKLESLKNALKDMPVRFVPVSGMDEPVKIVETNIPVHTYV